MSVVGFKKFCVFSPLRGDLAGKFKFPTGVSTKLARKVCVLTFSATLPNDLFSNFAHNTKKNFLIKNSIFQLDNLSHNNAKSSLVQKRLTQTRVVSRKIMADTNGGLEIPSCDVCGKPAVIEQAYSGRILCGEHLAKSIRKKVAKELRKQLILKKGERTTIFVAISEARIPHCLSYWLILLALGLM